MSIFVILWRNVAGCTFRFIRTRNPKTFGQLFNYLQKCLIFPLDNPQQLQLIFGKFISLNQTPLLNSYLNEPKERYNSRNAVIRHQYPFSTFSQYCLYFTDTNIRSHHLQQAYQQSTYFYLI